MGPKKPISKYPPERHRQKQCTDTRFLQDLACRRGVFQHDVEVALVGQVEEPGRAFHIAVMSLSAAAILISNVDVCNQRSSADVWTCQTA